MPDLRGTRRKVNIALATMLVVDLAVVALYFSPLIGTNSSRRQQLSDLWKELQQKTEQVQPLQGLDKKIPIAQKQINDFYKTRFPAQNSAISDNIGKLAGESGVKVGSIKYDMKDPETLGLQPVEIEADLAGGYLQLVRFINSLERDQMFFLVNSVHLGGEQSGVVRLQMKIETYLKTGTA
jgi:type IV pilus assembly protein PilO